LVQDAASGKGMRMSTSAEPAVSVADHPDQHRFEAELSGSVVGLAAYHLDENTIVFTHTEVSDEAEGKGVGSALAKTALDDARSRNLRVVPQCQFIAGYIGRHSEYLDLVDEENRELVSRSSE
jgi:predicted GNAT family acetyltransferase